MLLLMLVLTNIEVHSLQIGKNPMQSAGAYAIVNSMKNNPESAIVEIELSVS